MTTRAPVTSSSALITRLPRRHAASRPRLVRVRVKVGTKAAVIAPSAKRSRSRFGDPERDVERVHLHAAAGAEKCRQHHLPGHSEQPAGHGRNADEACGARELATHRAGTGRGMKSRVTGIKGSAYHGEAKKKPLRCRRGQWRMDERLCVPFKTIRRNLARKSLAELTHQACAGRSR